MVSRGRRVRRQILMLVIVVVAMLGSLSPSQIAFADHTITYEYANLTNPITINDVLGLPSNNGEVVITGDQSWQYCGTNSSGDPFFKDPGLLCAQAGLAIVLNSEGTGFVYFTDGNGNQDTSGGTDVHNVILNDASGQPVGGDPGGGGFVDGDFQFIGDPNDIQLNQQAVLGPDGATYSYCDLTNSVATFGDCANLDGSPQIQITGFPPVQGIQFIPALWSFEGETHSISITTEAGGAEVSTGGASDRSCSAYALVGWILCPLISGIFRFIEFLFNDFILVHLVVNPLNDAQNAGAADRAIFEIWNSFRIIANVLFVVVFLLAIFGQGLAGFQFFSAYDFRKIMPRLVIGAIGIQLSWYIVGFMVDLFNILGAGTRGLILAPVQGLDSLDFDFGSIGELVGIVLGGSAVFVARYAVAVDGILLLLPSILLPIALALVMALVVILFRKMLIFVLIVVSPIAFVLGILPNTQGFFKQWWEYLWKALFMYPLIVGFIAAGELTAKVLVAGDKTSASNQFLGMIALFAPYFLITTTFRLAGAGLAAAAGGLQNMSGGLKEKVLGDVRDPTSIRARRRDEFRNKRQSSLTSFMQRNQKGTPSTLNPFRRGRPFWKSLGKGAQAPPKIRKSPLTGKQFSIGIPGGPPDLKTGVRPKRSFNVAGIAGGLTAGLLARVGGVTVDNLTAAANEREMQTASLLADYDASVLMAALGATKTPDGGNISAESIAEGRRWAKNNPSAVTAAAASLMFWARDPDTTHEWIREQIRDNNLGFDRNMRDKIWDDSTNYLKPLHPSLNSIDLDGKFKIGKIMETWPKANAQLSSGGVQRWGTRDWQQLMLMRDLALDPSNGLSVGNREAFFRTFNRRYEKELDFIEISTLGRPEFRASIEKQIYFDTNGNLQRLDPDFDPSRDPMPADYARPADPQLAIQDPRSKEWVYDIIRQQKGWTGPEYDNDPRKVLMKLEPDKYVSETVGGHQGRMWFFRNVTGDVGISDDAMNATIEAVRNGGGTP